MTGPGAEEMDFSGMFTTQGMLLLLLVLGFVLVRAGIIPPEGKKLLSALTVNVTLPASILHAFQMEFNAGIARSCVAIALVGLCIQLGGAALAQLLYRSAPPERRSVLQYGTLVSNAGILGTVIAEGIFGSLGVLYASVYVIPQRIIMWTLGVSYFEGSSDKKAALRRVALNPCILAVAAGLVIMLCQIRLPGVLSLTIKNLAGGNTMCAMLLVGSVLAQTDLKTIAEPQALRYCAVRLVLIPGLVLLACRLAGVDSLVTSVSVVLSGTPAPTTVTALATRYGVAEQFAAKCVVGSTLLSLATIPLWCIIVR